MWGCVEDVEMSCRCACGGVTDVEEGCRCVRRGIAMWMGV